MNILTFHHQIKQSMFIFSSKMWFDASTDPTANKMWSQYFSIQTLSCFLSFSLSHYGDGLRKAKNAFNVAMQQRHGLLCCCSLQSVHHVKNETTANSKIFKLSHPDKSRKQLKWQTSMRDKNAALNQNWLTTLLWGRRTWWEKWLISQKTETSNLWQLAEGLDMWAQRPHMRFR